jgi:hypothetical protein
MKRLFTFFIASILLAGCSGVSFAAFNSRNADISVCKIISIEVVRNNISVLNDNGEDSIFEMDAGQFSSNVTVLKKKSTRAPIISKCNKSRVFVIDKKSILKVAHFKSDIEFCNAYFKDGPLNLMTANDLFNLSTDSAENIHKTSLTTLQSFLL